ncbi:MAG: twin-arginine translocase TatA/TatE family subunit [Candidatus Lernaella stagnicola]|nr:twin-arginine translocase TatA/TatE family subunit [Candidatus Lernaella stagnicola]
MSFGEIVVVLVLALVVVGPKNLPKVARSMGRAYAWVRHHLAVMQREINMEMRRIDMEVRESATEPNVAGKQEATPDPGPAYDDSESPQPPEHDASILEGGEPDDKPPVEISTTGNPRIPPSDPDADEDKPGRASVEDSVAFSAGEDSDQ